MQPKCPFVGAAFPYAVGCAFAQIHIEHDDPRLTPTSFDRLPVHRSESPTGYFPGGLLPSGARFRFTSHQQ